MLIAEIIRRKRDGETLGALEIGEFIQGVSDGRVGEGQMAALAMACFFRGLDTTEQVHLTRAMTQSGTVLTWESLGLGGPVLDKHSTGGVGDKVSLILAPLVAACGGFVPMISGRGLGHTGGTLDKLESLPGYDVTPELARFRQVVREVGCAIVGQSEILAPADRRLYAVRDTTASVDVPGLIVSSILSKKLAAGLHGLVMDVKTGSGAVLREHRGAEALARQLVQVAVDAGLPTVALLTDMDEVLGYSAGNALEVREALDFLSGRERNQRLQEVVLALAVEMLCLGKLAESPDSAHRKAVQALSQGRAAEIFARMVAALGGPADVFQDPQLASAPVVRPLPAREAGFLAAVDTRAVGLAVIGLGGGRRGPGDPVDHRVGLSRIRQIGDWLESEQPLALIHAVSEADAETAVVVLHRAFKLNSRAPATHVLHGRIA